MRLPELVGAVAAGGAGLVLVPVSPWSLLLLPPALVVGLAAARGVGLRTVWATVEHTDSGDAGAGPAGLHP